MAVNNIGFARQAAFDMNLRQKNAALVVFCIEFHARVPHLLPKSRSMCSFGVQLNFFRLSFLVYPGLACSQDQACFFWPLCTCQVPGRGAPHALLSRLAAAGRAPGRSLCLRPAFKACARRRRCCPPPWRCRRRRLWRRVASMRSSSASSPLARALRLSAAGGMSCSGLVGSQGRQEALCEMPSRHVP